MDAAGFSLRQICASVQLSIVLLNRYNIILLQIGQISMPACDKPRSSLRRVAAGAAWTLAAAAAFFPLLVYALFLL